MAIVDIHLPSLEWEDLVADQHAKAELQKSQLAELEMIKEATIEHCTKLIDAQKAQHNRLKKTMADFSQRYSQVHCDGSTATAITKLEQLTHKLARLCRNEEYLLLVLRFIQLQESVQSRWDEQDLEQAVEAFSQLKDLQEALEEERPNQYEHLQAALKQVVTDQAARIEPVLTEHLTNQLALTAWPKELSDWEDPVVVRLLLYIATYCRFRDVISAGDGLSKVLNVLLDSISVRFNFHFSTTTTTTVTTTTTTTTKNQQQPTARLDRPEWAYRHLLELARVHSAFIYNCLTEFVKPKLSGNSHRNATISRPAPLVLDAFIERLVGLAVSKLKAEVDSICKDTILLAHHIEAAIEFHESLRNQLGYLGIDDGGEGEDERRQQCVQVFLGNDRIRAIWISSERQSALERYQELLRDDSFGWWYHPTDPMNLLCSLKGGANDLNHHHHQCFPIQFIALIDQYIQIIRPIASVKAKVALCRHVVMSLFDLFMEKATFDLPIFHTSSQDRLAALAMANGLYTVLQSIRTQWADDLVLVEIGRSMKEGGGFSTESLSSSLGSPVMGAGVFAKYQAGIEELLDEKLIPIIVRAIYEEFVHETNHYARSMCYGVTWTRDQTNDPLSEPLCRALLALPRNIETLRTHLHPDLLKPALASLARGCCEYFFEGVVLVNLFHLPGARKFTRDLDTVTETLKTIFPEGAGITDLMAKSRQAATLLTLAERAADGKPSAVAIEASLDQGDFDRLSGILEPLGINELTFEEIGQILSLRR